MSGAATDMREQIEAVASCALCIHFTPNSSRVIVSQQHGHMVQSQPTQMHSYELNSNEERISMLLSCVHMYDPQVLSGRTPSSLCIAADRWQRTPSYFFS